MASKSLQCEGWNFERTLGSGGFGVVELWVNAQNGKKVAIKRCKLDVKHLTPTQQKRWKNEVEIMKSLSHPNIVKPEYLPFKVLDEDSLPILCMEYCRKGDLRKVLNKTENCCGISEKEALKVMSDILSAVEYLHSHSITHRDLKPENIVLQDERDVISYKLIDLGYAKELGDASISASIVGTLNYVAPELLWNEKYSCSVDYWSLGILFYELVTGTRPFLPRMQHTKTWMQYIKNKDYDVICAYESDGEVRFGKDIEGPTNLSRCVRNKLVEWFRVVLQWDPKKRGKQFDETGTLKLVVFEMLKSILSKKIVYVFSITMYKMYAYEIDSSTTIGILKQYIERDTTIPATQQTLTDYFGNVLTANEILPLSQTDNTVLFVFKNGCKSVEDAFTADIPKAVQSMMDKVRNLLDYDTLKEYYRITVFFIRREVNIFQLYIFALTIKIDLVNQRVNNFNENMENALENINSLMTEVKRIHSQLTNKMISDDKKEALENNYRKINKLASAANQIKIKFSSLREENSMLGDIAKKIDCVKDLSKLSDEVAQVYETFKKDTKCRNAKPLEMTKLVFHFLKCREDQLYNENITKFVRQLTELEDELPKLEGSFNSVTTMTVVYREELQNIAELNNTSEQPVSSNPLTIFNELTSTDNDLIYENLLIRHTLDNFMVEMQRQYLEMMSLDP